MVARPPSVSRSELARSREEARVVEEGSRSVHGGRCGLATRTEVRLRTGEVAVFRLRRLRLRARARARASPLVRAHPLPPPPRAGGPPARLPGRRPPPHPPRTPKTPPR